MSAAAGVPSRVLEAIAQAVRAMRYGTVVVTVHGGRVVQIEKTEKVRVDAPADPMPGSVTEHGSPDRISGSARPPTPS